MECQHREVDRRLPAEPGVVPDDVSHVFARRRPGVRTSDAGSASLMNVPVLLVAFDSQCSSYGAVWVELACAQHPGRGRTGLPGGSRRPAGRRHTGGDLACAVVGVSVPVIAGAPVPGPERVWARKPAEDEADWTVGVRGALDNTHPTPRRRCGAPDRARLGSVTGPRQPSCQVSSPRRDRREPVDNGTIDAARRRRLAPRTLGKSFAFCGLDEIA